VKADTNDNFPKSAISFFPQTINFFFMSALMFFCIFAENRPALIIFFYFLFFEKLSWSLLQLVAIYMLCII